MESKQIDVRCPACRASLAVDVRTARVVRWSDEKPTDPLGRPKVTDRDWEAALGRVKAREERADGLLESALDRERERQQGLDDRFAHLSARLDGSERAAGGGPLASRGRGLVQALMALDEGIAFVRDKSEALEARADRLRAVGEGHASSLGAQLARLGFHVERTLGVWARAVGARERAAASETSIEVDGEGLALAPELDDDADPSHERARLEGALVAAERAEARVIAVRAAALSPHEEGLVELDFRLSHSEQIWIRGGR